MNDLSTSFSSKNPFEESKKIDKNGNEYWIARELMKIFDYSQWQRFIPVIDKARQACTNSGKNVDDQFIVVDELIEVGRGALYKTKGYHLTRYACYLIAQNGNPSKKFIALAQTYFAIQTRRQEAFDQLPEEERRLIKRKHVSDHNIELGKVAGDSGVENFGYFHNKGYEGMYAGTNKMQIQRYKGIGDDNPLDRAGTVELAANDFRITQTAQKLSSHLKNNEKLGQAKASQTHYDIGKITREAMGKAGNPMPEDLKPEIHIKDLKKKKKLEREMRDRPQLGLK